MSDVLEELDQIVQQTSPAPPPEMSKEERAKVAELAALPKTAYDKRRKGEAKALGWRVSTLDEKVAALRPAPEDDPRQGSEIDLSVLDPWPEVVDGRSLVAGLQDGIQRHVVLSEHQALAVALWVLHSHSLDKAEHSPRLHISSPEKRCGKTVLLSVISALALRPLATENISSAALFRVVEAHGPTLLIDEVDAFLSDNEDMRGLLNAGHGRAGRVIRLVGDNHEPRAFSVFGPVALAGIGEIPSTIEDRSITISLRRRRKDEEVERLRRNRDHLQKMNRQCARWLADNLDRISEDPPVPDELNDRAQDNWRPLLAIADAMGPEIAAAARTAARVLEKEKEGDADSAGVMLLADLHSIFGTFRTLSSEFLVAELVKLEDRPWKTWRRGHELTKNSLARLLKPFDIRPKQIMAHNGKGYVGEQIIEAYNRYCVAKPEEEIEGEPDPM